MATPGVQDLSYEEDILRDPYSLKNWWYYLEFKQHASPEIRNLIYERALRVLPRSYKMWWRYLDERMQHVRELCVTDVAYEQVNHCFERCLVHMYKMPRMWKLYLEFLMKQKIITKTRHAFDKALRALPCTQHLRWIWPLYIQFARESNVPEMASRVWRRYLKLEPKEKEEYIKYLKKAGRLDMAASELAEIVNDERFISTQGKSKHDLWSELLNLIVKNPKKVISINVDAVIRGGIRRFSHEVGHLWTSLSDYYIRQGYFEKARDIYEEGINSVSSVRDFSVIYEAYSQYEESMLSAKMEMAKDSTEEDEDFEQQNTDIEMRVYRMEQLIRRQPLLLSSVLLRQNPHNVKEWHKRVAIFEEGENKDLAKVIMTYTDAVTTVDPQKASGKPHTLWVAFARFYEKHNDLANARTIFEKATQVNYKNLDELATLWCEWAECELRAKKWEQAREVLKKATAVPAVKLKWTASSERQIPVQQRVYRSTKLWAFYADLEETFGTVQTCKSVYEQMIDLKVATPAIILNYATYMEEKKYFEDSFRVYEKGINLFEYPHVYPIWVSYLRKFISRYQGSKLERTRDLFEESVEKAPAKESEKLYLLFAKFEEDYGLIRRAMDVYSRGCENCTQENKLKFFFIYIKRCSEYFGVTKTRDIYESAMKKLSDQDLKPLCLRYSALERHLGEIDRARAIFVWGAQFADPREHQDYWTTWHEFEVASGNKDTFMEMLRVRRTVSAQHSQAMRMTTNVTKKEDKPIIDPNNNMAALEAQQQQNSAAESAAEAQEAADEARANAAFAKPVENEEEIDLDEDGDSDDEDSSDDDTTPAKKPGDVEIETQAVPAGVFGSAAGK